MACTRQHRQQQQHRPRRLAPTTLALAALAALAAAALLAPIRGADAHVVMIEPKSRPWFDYLLNYNYNPHAVFAGGVPKVSRGGALQWPAHDMAGICGDALGEAKWDVPGQLGATYTAGQVIKTDVIMAQNHLGRMHVRLCPLAAKSEAECRDLQRADGKGSAYDLPWTKGWSGVTDGFTPPQDASNLPFGFYKMAPVGKADGCAAWACDQFKGQYVYSFAWRLPEGFACEHCKLQLYYLTGSRCWPPCIKEQNPGCTKPVDYAFCGAPGATYPEEFWNCADVKVVAGGSSSSSGGSGSSAAAAVTTEAGKKQAAAAAPQQQQAPAAAKASSSNPAPAAKAAVAASSGGRKPPTAVMAAAPAATVGAAGRRLLKQQL